MCGLTGLDILTRCKNGLQDIDTLNDMIQFRRDSLDRCASCLDGIPHATSGVHDRFADLLAQIDQLEKRCTLRKRQHAAELCAGIWILERLPILECHTLKLIYLDGFTICAAGHSLGYSDSSVRRFKASGEKKCAAMPWDSIQRFLPDWYASETSEMPL